MVEKFGALIIFLVLVLCLIHVRSMSLLWLLTLLRTLTLLLKSPRLNRCQLVLVHSLLSSVVRRSMLSRRVAELLLARVE